MKLLPLRMDQEPEVPVSATSFTPGCVYHLKGERFLSQPVGTRVLGAPDLRVTEQSLRLKVRFIPRKQSQPHCVKK